MSVAAVITGRMGRDTCPSRWRGSFDLPLKHKSIIFNRTEKMCLMSRPALSYHSRYLDGVPLVITQGDWHKLTFLLKYQACSLLTFSYKSRKLHYNSSSKRKTPLNIAIRKLNLWLYVNCNRNKAKRFAKHTAVQSYQSYQSYQSICVYLFLFAASEYDHSLTKWSPPLQP